MDKFLSTIMKYYTPFSVSDCTVEAARRIGRVMHLKLLAKAQKDVVFAMFAKLATQFASKAQTRLCAFNFPVCLLCVVCCPWHVNDVCAVGCGIVYMYILTTHACSLKPQILDGTDRKIHITQIARPAYFSFCTNCRNKMGS